MSASSAHFGDSPDDVRLTPLAGARNHLEPLDFIGRAGRAQPATGVRAGMARILLHDQGDKKQELRGSTRAGVLSKLGAVA